MKEQELKSITFTNHDTKYTVQPKIQPGYDIVIDKDGKTIHSIANSPVEIINDINGCIEFSETTPFKIKEYNNGTLMLSNEGNANVTYLDEGVIVKDNKTPMSIITMNPLKGYPFYWWSNGVKVLDLQRWGGIHRFPLGGYEDTAYGGDVYYNKEQTEWYIGTDSSVHTYNKVIDVPYLSKYLDSDYLLTCITKDYFIFKNANNFVVFTSNDFRFAYKIQNISNLESRDQEQNIIYYTRNMDDYYMFNLKTKQERVISPYYRLFVKYCSEINISNQCFYGYNRNNNMLYICDTTRKIPVVISYNLRSINIDYRGIKQINKKTYLLYGMYSYCIISLDTFENYYNKVTPITYHYWSYPNIKKIKSVNFIDDSDYQIDFLAFSTNANQTEYYVHTDIVPSYRDIRLGD